MPKIKTSELIGPALDWAAEEAQGYGKRYLEFWNIGGDKRFIYCQVGHSPSTQWYQGGPVIEREHICVLAPIVRRISAERHAFEVAYWRAMRQSDEDTPCVHGRGPTPLIAAMRCYVASELGDEVEVPEELLT